MLYLILTIFSIIVMIIGCFILKMAGREVNSKNVLMILVLCLLFSGLVIMIVHTTAEKEAVNVREYELLSLKKYKVVKEEYMSGSKSRSSSDLIYKYETKEFGEGDVETLKNENVKIKDQKSGKNTLEIVDYEYANDFTKKLLGDRKWTRYEFFVDKKFIETLPTRHDSGY